MDVVRQKYYSNYFHRVIWRFIIADGELRSILQIGRQCGFVTFFMGVLILVTLACSVMSTKIAKSNEMLCRSLQNQVNEKLPRKRSILRVKPAYNCIHEHLQKTFVTLEKIKQTVHKESLEIDMMKSKISCMTKLMS
ncbi:uncharacterized protein LOC135165430 isoform X2 [Diachasmimorpha longicaudata]|uniref:uncharacterized protein LOC135165430 isoform X2 n=1 Tax=Diachasmimorpha longicaudata TaxID=58733 RepID=UPI0030B8EBAC